MTFTIVAAEAYRDFAMDGVPSSGPHDPKKSEIRQLLGAYERAIDTYSSGAGSIAKATRDLLFADLAHEPDVTAWVYEDPTVGYNGIYVKVGSAGTGSWTRILDLPFSFIPAANAGDGTSNAIEAISPFPIASNSLVAMNIVEPNGSGPVTVRFNGSGPAYRIKTSGGNDPTIGSLTEGMQILGRISGDDFRLYTDQASAEIIAAAEAYAIQAAAAAENADPNTWTIDTFVGEGVEQTETLSFAPGAKNAIFMTIDGIEQGGAAFDLDGLDVTFTTPEGGEEVRFRYGVRIITEGPPPGSVGANELASESVTEAKHATGGVSTRALADGAATKVKIANDSIDETKIDDTRVAQIRALLGIKVWKEAVSEVTTAFSATALTTYNEPLSDAVTFTPSSPTSRLRVTAVCRCDAIKSSDAIDDLGGRFIIKRFDGSAYQNTNALAVLRENNRGVNTSVTMSGNQTVVCELTPAQRRSDTNDWTVRLYGNVDYSGNTFTVQNTVFSFTEYEP